MNTIDHSAPRAGQRAARLLPVLLAAAIAAACSSNASPGDGAPPPPEVSVAGVVERTVQQWDDFTGRISAVETVELRPRVSGYVQQVAFEEGQLLHKGDLLFEIDPRPYQAALARAEAELARARSEARLAGAQHERAKALVEARAISREEYETRNAASAQGNAAVRAAEAAVAAARLDLQFTRVISPIDGRAGRALVTAGNLAQADATVLTTVVSQDPVHVYFEADEQTWLRYSRGSSEDQRVGTDRAVRVGLAGEDGWPHAGTLDFIDNRVDPATGTIRARAVLRNPDGLFTPGLFARVQLEGGAESAALLVDDKAVLTDQDRKYVYVLGEDNTAQRRDVELGRMAGGLRVVRSGLSPDDRVIVSGVQKVFMPGMPVAPTEVAMEGPGDMAGVVASVK